MRPDKSRWTLAASAPLALAAVLAAAPQATAGVAGAALSNPRVLTDGGTLSVDFTSAVSDQAADTAEARNVAASLVGEWAGQLIDDAARNNPPRVSTCQVKATATDPDGAAGTASAAVPSGVGDTPLTIPDQAAGTKWGVGDLDHFTVELTCTDTGAGGSVSRAVIDQDETAV
jgi:hypothetical protein